MTHRTKYWLKYLWHNIIRDKHYTVEFHNNGRIKLEIYGEIRCEADRIKEWWESGLIKRDQSCGKVWRSRWWNEDGVLMRENIGKPHKKYKCIHWDRAGQIRLREYYLYGNKVSEEEYRKHELVEELSGLGEEHEKTNDI